MRCRYRKTIFLNEENGYTIAVFTTRMLLYRLLPETNTYRARK